MAHEVCADSVLCRHPMDWSSTCIKLSTGPSDLNIDVKLVAKRRRKKVDNEFASVTWNIGRQLMRRGGLSELRTTWLDLFLSGRVLGAIIVTGPCISCPASACAETWCSIVKAKASLT